MKKIYTIFFIVFFFNPQAASPFELSLLYNEYEKYNYLNIQKAEVSTILAEAKLIALAEESKKASDLSSDGGSPEPSGLSWDILGKKGKRIHASLSLTGVYTDNAYNSSVDEESDLSLYLSPEIWITFPRVRTKPQDIRSTSSRSPGGMALSRSSPVIERRYQAHLIYRADIPVYSVNSPSDDTISHRFGGGITYKGNRFQLDVIDRFLISYEDRGTGISTAPSDVDEYKSNFFNTILSYDTRNRFRLRFDYSNYRIDYDDDRNAFRERTDNSYSAYVFYKLRPRTALFVQYNFIDIQYDDNRSLDSYEHNLFGGVQWDVTAKTKGLLKAGYGIKEFKNTGEDDSNFLLETQVHYKFTPKTSFRFLAFSKTSETDVVQASHIISSGIEGEYQQMLTARITGLARLSYVNDEYSDDFTFGGQPGQRDDNTTQASIGLQYRMRRWLQGSLGYIYERRDSNFDYFDYTSNSIFLRITGSI
jgi:hypothetical protein